jgi:nuclease S1
MALIAHSVIARTRCAIARCLPRWSRLRAFAPGLLVPALVIYPADLSRPVWSDEGHRLVARLAETRLTPRTAEAVRELLGGQSLADASLWADQIRGLRRETAPLHYVNIPLTANAYLPARDCPRGRCIIAAIESDERVLADASAPTAKRAEALRFLIHFIGDLHQPLHVSDDGDRGGNDRPVTFLGTSRNLHQVWDGELIQASGMNESQYYDHLRLMMASLDLSALERGSVADWAMEGHRIAAEHAYRIPPGNTLDQTYVETNLPLVDRSLIAAGVRLARVLNVALAKYTPTRHGEPPLGPGVYTDREAAAHVGETATVVGTLVSIHRSRGGKIFLNFGADYPHQTFSGAVLHPRGTWYRGLDSLVGKRVGVRGRIERYKGRVEIVIERADQVVQSIPNVSPH